MPYKIAITVTNDLNQDQRMHRICNSLLSAGYQVILIGREKKSSQELLHQKFNQKRLDCYFESGVLFYLEFNVRLFFFLLFESYDILYSVDLDTLSSVSLVSILKRRKLIYDAHEYFVEVPELEGAKLKKWLWSIVGKIFIPSSDLNITVNKELSEIFSAKYRQHFEVIRSLPWLVENYSGQKREDEKIILYQGVLNKGRGLAEAITWTSNTKQNVKLLIVGEGDLSTELRKLKSQVDKENRVHFLGWKSPKELDEITKTAWLGLNLLDGSSLNYKYSLANKFFSYMHAGIPSLNMDFPVYWRYCSEFNVGLCLPDLKEESIEKAVSTLIHDPIRHQKMVLSTKIAVHENCWQHEEIKLLGLIEEMMTR
ncbi:MAG: glycosyltransferase involved in cell wall biosynthesis [Saprospiraceae bacterium]|jgi:glycosyltransferase involved in cell wall biosynthesis